MTIHNERIILTLNQNNSLRSATVFPIEYLDEQQTSARQLPPVDLSESQLDDLIELLSASTVAERDALQQQLTAANARIAQLEASLPWNPRIIDAAAFIARIQPNELVELFGSQDATTQQIAAMLKAYRDNDWPIVFESPEMQQAIGYLQQTGLLTAERADELKRDSTREEAYDAD